MGTFSEYYFIFIYRMWRTEQFAHFRIHVVGDVFEARGKENTSQRIVLANSFHTRRKAILFTIKVALARATSCTHARMCILPTDGILRLAHETKLLLILSMSSWLFAFLLWKRPLCSQSFLDESILNSTFRHIDIKTYICAGLDNNTSVFIYVLEKRSRHEILCKRRLNFP